MSKEQQKFLLKSEIRDLSQFQSKNIKKEIWLEIDWDKGKSEKKQFQVEKDGKAYKFEVEIKKVRKGLFKDKVESLSINPVEGENFEFPSAGSGSPKLEPGFWRPTGFIIIGVVAVLMIGGITAWVLWKRKKKR